MPDFSPSISVESGDAQPLNNPSVVEQAIAPAGRVHLDPALEDPVITVPEPKDPQQILDQARRALGYGVQWPGVSISHEDHEKMLGAVRELASLPPETAIVDAASGLRLYSAADALRDGERHGATLAVREQSRIALREHFKNLPYSDMSESVAIDVKRFAALPHWKAVLNLVQPEMSFREVEEVRDTLGREGWEFAKDSRIDVFDALDSALLDHREKMERASDGWQDNKGFGTTILGILDNEYYELEARNCPQGLPDETRSKLDRYVGELLSASSDPCESIGPDAFERRREDVIEYLNRLINEVKSYQIPKR